MSARQIILTGVDSKYWLGQLVQAMMNHLPFSDNLSCHGPQYILQSVIMMILLRMSAGSRLSDSTQPRHALALASEPKLSSIPVNQSLSSPQQPVSYMHRESENCACECIILLQKFSCRFLPTNTLLMN